MEKAHVEPVERRKRSPKCAKCQVHNVVSNLKGHKGYCPFDDCLCIKCGLVLQRRGIMKTIIAQKRRCDIEDIRTANLASQESTTSPSTSGYKKLKELSPLAVYILDNSESIKDAIQKTASGMYGFGLIFII